MVEIAETRTLLLVRLNGVGRHSKPTLFLCLLGGESDPNATTDGPTSNAVKQALANGVYVVAAAGNDGGNDDDGRVATPSDVPGVISVGALDVDGEYLGRLFSWLHQR